MIDKLIYTFNHRYLKHAKSVIKSLGNVFPNPDKYKFILITAPDKPVTMISDDFGLEEFKRSNIKKGDTVYIMHTDPRYMNTFIAENVKTFDRCDCLAIHIPTPRRRYE